MCTYISSPPFRQPPSQTIIYRIGIPLFFLSSFVLNGSIFVMYVFAYAGALDEAKENNELQGPGDVLLLLISENLPFTRPNFNFKLPTIFFQINFDPEFLTLVVEKFASSVVNFFTRFAEFTPLYFLNDLKYVATVNLLLGILRSLTGFANIALRRAFKFVATNASEAGGGADAEAEADAIRECARGI